MTRRPRSLLVVCSSLELETPFSATPAWWQLLKALAESGVTLHVTSYHGRVPETLWWTAYRNPLRVAGEAVRAFRNVVPRAGRETAAQAGARRVARAVVAPIWLRHLSSILEKNGDIEAVLLLSVPPNHLRGVPAALRARFGKPVFFYDGDVPASLPDAQGFASGFRIYDGADLSEFDGVLSNSDGGRAALAALGARKTHTLHYAADPQVYVRRPVAEDVDVFFYGHSSEYREECLEAMIGVPSVALPEARFAVRGHGLSGTGRAEHLPYRSFSRLCEYVSRSRINLVVTRQEHARVHASSTMRPFELAMLGACIVSNPSAGLEEWFEPGREIVVVGSSDEAIDRYRYLLGHEAERRALGEAARRRALSEHTFARRAGQLLDVLGEAL